ncbi:MAG: hypothetical protein U9Q38_06370 [Thermodesulfobacteriota bacterium]|nr:hypothetical protein [Thermodesulfobacteriota bacterium]
MGQKTEFVNLTMHDIFITGGITIPAPVVSDHPCRVEKTVQVEYRDDVKIITNVYGKIFGLPEPKDNTIYIVSAVVLNALGSSRPDVVAVAGVIRGKNGEVTCCTGLRTNG